MAAFTTIPSELLLCIAECLEYSWDVNSISGRTCLWGVMQRHQLGVMQRHQLGVLTALLDRGASPMLTDSQGDTVLYEASVKGFFEGVRMILAWVASNSHHPEFGITHEALRAQICKAKSKAAARGSWKIARVLERFKYTQLM